MKFQPKTADELAMDNLLPEGKYPFTVAEAEETISKKGNPMLKIKLTVWGEGNRQSSVFDYILESIPDKLFRFCSVIGLENKYHAGELEAEDCVGRDGWAHIKIQPAEGSFGPKNVVGFYCNQPAPENGSAPASESAKRRPDPFPDSGDDDDSIPF